MKNTENKNVVLNLIPRLAKKVGEQSVNAACALWVCQPTVPQSMKKSK